MAASPDLRGAASHLHMAAHLPGPFAAGAALRRLDLDAEGRVAVTQRTREPAVLLTLAAPMGDERLVVEAEAGDRPLAPLTFEAYAEAGAFLLLYRPDVEEADRMAAPFTLRLRARRAAGGAGADVPVTGVCEVHLVEGLMGRMLVALGAETPRLRSQARRLAASRRLEGASGAALDRHGADLRVPRFDDDIVARDGQILTVTAREDDADYRRRLALYRPFLVPSRRAVLARLNGPGEDDEPARGPLAALGVAARVRLVEADDPFALAVHLVEAGDGGLRGAFLDFVRRVHLVIPGPSGAPLHRARYLSAEQRAADRALRRRLRDGLTLPDRAAFAPGLAAALDLAVRCRRALGLGTPWQVFRAQDEAAGSRYELGLGADLRPLTDGQLAAFAEAVAGVHGGGGLPDADPATLEAVLAMRPAALEVDPDGEWFFRACGFQTVHRVSTGIVYVSPLAGFGLVIEGASDVAPGGSLPLAARYHASGDPGRNAALAEALVRADRAWRAGGGEAWTSVPDDRAPDVWAEAQPYGEAGDVLRAAGLPLAPEPARQGESLRRISGELVETLVLPDRLAASVRAGESQAVAPLRELVDALTSAGVAAALPLATGAGGLALVASAIGLPETGANLSGRRTTGFRWYPVALSGPEPALKPIGSRTVVRPRAPGLTAIVVLGYARRGATDPYEVRAELPPESALSITQYEFLMNALEHLHPLGVEVNTFGLRRGHVDLGDGPAPLPPSLAKTFRPFRPTS